MWSCPVHYKRCLQFELGSTPPQPAIISMSHFIPFITFKMGRKAKKKTVKPASLPPERVAPSESDDDIVVDPTPGVQRSPRK